MVLGLKINQKAGFAEQNPPFDLSDIIF